MLGSGAVIVMDDSRCMVQSLQRLSYFYMHESCGQCTPCREGTGWLWRMVDRMYKIASMMGGRTICALSDAAAMPTMSIVKKFGDEIKAHLNRELTA